MPFMYEITFLPERVATRFYGSRGNYYLMSGVGTLKLLLQLVWCRKCGDFSEAERLPSMEEIDARIATIRRWGEQFRMQGIPGEEKGSLKREMEELTLRRAWRHDRVTPPKCIKCGSLSFVLLNEGVVANPTGSGTIEIRTVGMCSSDFNDWTFTPEGDRIRSD